MGITSIPVQGQYIYYDVHLLGETTIHNFDVKRIYNIKKTGGDWGGPNIDYKLDMVAFYGSDNSVLNNTQYRFNYNVSAPSGVNFTHHIYQDSYGNDKLIIDINVQKTYTSNNIPITVTYEVKEKLSLNLNDPSDLYPLTGIPANISSTYLAATDLIDSDNTSIQSKASSIISGCSTEFSIVNELAEWIKANIGYAQGTSEKASDVLSTRVGDCDGMANLMIAFCRSLGIPARINGGYSIKVEKNYVIWDNTPITFSSGANGVGDLNGHACYEVYYPTLSNWIPGDPAQQTASFTHAGNVWYGHYPELPKTNVRMSVSGTLEPGMAGPTGLGFGAPPIPFIESPLSISEDFDYVYHNEFSGSLNKAGNILLNSSDQELPEPPVGPNDNLTIKNPPSGLVYPPIGGTVIPNNTLNFAPGENISFYAQFSSYYCNTAAVTYNWKVELYHSEGTYTYISESTSGYDGWPSSCESCTHLSISAPTTLPDYEWQRNDDGTIHGKIFVESLDNNGYVNKSDNEYIRLEYKPNKPSITVLDSDDRSITFEFLAQGASSYKVHYSDGSGTGKYYPPFVNGNDAYEGSSPVNVGDKTVFHLTDIPVNSRIAVTGVNSFGESIYSEPVTYSQYAPLPYVVSYFSDEQYQNFSFLKSSYGRIGLDDNGRSNNCLVLDSYQNGQYATNYVDFFLNCNNLRNVVLDFWWKDFGDEYHAEVDGVWLSVDGGSSFTKIYDLNGANYTNNVWSNHTVSLSDKALAEELTLTEKTIVRFGQKDNYAAPTDGFALDDIKVYEHVLSNIINDAMVMINPRPNYGNVANTNYGNYDRLSARQWTHGGYHTKMRSFLEIDISAIPSGSVINSATLDLYSPDPQPNDEYKQLGTNTSSYCKENSSVLSRVTSPWSENEITWNNKPGTTSSNSKSLSNSLTVNQDYLNIDITQLVQDMVDDKENSHGLELKNQDPETFKSMVFASSDYDDEKLQPKIEIDFTVPTPTTIVITPSKDSWCLLNLKPGNESIEFTNYGSYIMNKADQWTHSGYGTNSFSLIDFDLSSIEEGTTIRKAYLSLYSPSPQANDDYKHMSELSTGSTTYKSNACWISRVIEDWNEYEVTYGTRPDITELHKKYLPISASKEQDYVDVDVTSLVQDMVNNPTKSFGFQFDLVDPQKYSRMAFASKEHTDGTLHPKLVIEYYSGVSNKSAGNMYPDQKDMNAEEEENSDAESNFTVYPNPAVEYVSINALEGSDIRIINIQGQVVLEQLANGPETNINISNLKVGIYIVEVTNNNISKRKSIVIAR